MLRSRVLLRLLPVAFGASLFAACSSASKLVGDGGECEQATDCDVGLVCLPQKGGSSICGNDLSGIQTPPEVPDAAGKDATASDGGVTDSTTPSNDGSTPPPADVNVPPQQDTSVPQADTSPPPVDASKPDTSPPPADAAQE